MRARPPLAGWKALWIAAALGLVALPASAQETRYVSVSLMVSHVSQQPGSIDPKAADLHRRLKHEFRYQSLRVLDQQRLRLALQEVGGLDLPTGRRILVRPMHLGSDGVLIAVEIEGTLQTDLRVPNREQVVIGAERYQDGKLIITLRPDF